MSAIIKALQKALEIDPANWETRQALMEALLADGNQEEAHALLSDIGALPDDAPSLLAAAKSYALAGSTADGRRIVEQVLERHPAHAEAHLTLSSIAHQEGDTRTARRHYLTATGINPKLASKDLDDAYGDGAETASAQVVAGSSVPEPEEEPVALAVQVVEDDEEESPPVQVTAEPDAPDSVAKADREPELVIARPPKKLAPKGEKTEEEPAAAAPIPASGTGGADAPQAVVALAVSEDEDDSEGEATLMPLTPEEIALLGEHYNPEDDDFDPEHLKQWRDHADEIRKRTAARDKLTSLTVTIALHVAVFVALGVVIVARPRDVPPQIVAQAAPAETPEDISQEVIQRTQVRPSSAAAAPTDFISAAAISNVAVANLAPAEMGVSTAFEVDFQPSMNFGDASMSPDSKMMFGQKIDGEVLGVILDVSGSMAEYLSAVVREVDKNFKNAPIVYVNHAGILGAAKDTEIHPIIEPEVTPYWVDEYERRHPSPYWFLWHDLPRKADQHYVDRLITTFKTRPNQFLARGGGNRVGAAAEFLSTQGIDSLYVFSDFEDFVDEAYCDTLGKSLGRKKIRTYVQPAAARTDHLHIVSRQVASRSGGKELPALTDLLRPGDLEDEPIGVAVAKEVPIPDGVEFATPREKMEDKNLLRTYWGSYAYYDDSKEILKVVEYPNFDLVIRGPAARAEIFLKKDGKYIQSPVIFGFHSHKPYLNERDGRTYYPRRKFLKNIEEPKFENDEFTWKMLLEDEISFEVTFWFKEDSLTGTYTAELPPEGQSDNAHIYFGVPPMARKKDELYVGIDFPGGISLDDLRLAMTKNIANFYLPVQAQDSQGTTWSRLGFKKGDNFCPYNIMYRDLPSSVREVTISGPSFGPRKLEARTTSNNLLLSTGNRADMELWEGFLCRLTRPGDRRHRVVKTEAIKFTIE